MASTNDPVETILDATDRVVVYADALGDDAVWKVTLTLNGITDSITITVDEIIRDDLQPLMVEILNTFYALMVLDADEWLEIRDAWEDQQIDPRDPEHPTGWA